MNDAPSTLRGRVLTALRVAGDRGVCLAELDGDLSYTARNRVAELRAAGHLIETEPCRQHRHRGGVRRYRLVVPQRGEQQSLPLGPGACADSSLHRGT